jgi:hypothetical protein
MPHLAESGDRSRTVRVAGSDLTDYANPPRLINTIILMLELSRDNKCGLLLGVCISTARMSCSAQTC